MTELCVLFNNGPAHPQAAERNFRQMVEMNPGAEVVPLTFDSGVKGSVVLNPVDWNVSNKWASADTLVYEYGLSENHVQAERYLLMEYDVFCTQSFKDFYADVWDCALAGPGYHYYIQGVNMWHWFSEDCPQGRFARTMYSLGAYGKNLCCMAPAIGILMSGEVYHKLCNFVRNPIFFNLFSEARIATALAMLGYKPKALRSDFTNFSSCKPEQPEIVGPGIWHPVKTVQG